MTIELEDAKNLDKILTHLANDKNRFFQIRDLNNQVLPTVEEEYIEVLVDILISDRRNLVIRAENVRLAKLIKAGGYLLPFLKGGGWESWYINEENKQKKAAERDSVEFNKINLEIETLRNQINDYPETKALAKSADKIGKDGLRLSRISLIVSGATLAITVTLVLLQRYKVWPFDN